MKPYHPLSFALPTLSLLLAVFVTQHLRVANATIDAVGNKTDYMALLAIKSKLIDGSPDVVLSSWNHSLHHCFWEGVTCGHKHNRVVVLDLEARGLAGTISPFIGNLSFLRKIALNENGILGPIPPEIGRLFRLQILRLYNNSLIGEIPASLASCTKLEVLSVGYNNLQGKLPMGLKALSHLKLLAVHFNNLNGPVFEVIESLLSLQIMSGSSNSFTGNFPKNLSGMTNLTFLNLSLNKLSGVIPQSISNLSSLTLLDLSENQLLGKLPSELGSLSNLEKLYVDTNNFNGIIPPSIFNLSLLTELDMFFNQLQGSIPSDIAFTLPRLQSFGLSDNYLTGPLPISLPNLTNNLHIIQLDHNNLTGIIPPHLGRLHNLELLSLTSNNFVGDISFISSLVNCTKLVYLDLQGNSFTGTLPQIVANLSNGLTWLGIGSNPIIGKIPIGMGNLINLTHIFMDTSNLTGTIPHDLGKLQKLESLDLHSNKLTGEIPNSFGNLSHLSKLYLNENKLHGRIPPSLGNCTYLLFLNLSSNKFNGFLPSEIFVKTNFIQLWLGLNLFQGSLPLEISNQKNLELFSVFNNYFSGEIPNVFNSLPSLQEVYMDHNVFHGLIPSSFSFLKSLLKLDLSYNYLSGPIPEYLSSFSLLYSLNISYNNFKGSVPTKGVFANASAISLFGNNGLCGGIHELHLPRCEEKNRKKREMSRVLKSTIIPIVCSFVGVLAMATCIWLYLTGYCRKRKSVSANPLDKESFFKVSYDMLLKATDGFSSGTLLGSGTFGSVFQGILNGETVAIKVLNLQQRGGLKSFMAECEALRNIRHRNLVGIITACSSMDFQRNDFKALVYEFMPNGSLDRWLHEDGNLSLLQRVNIAIDVAHALNYLHHECGSSIVHCDLKPSNILLDYDMVAHVSDFGLAKILAQPLHPNQSSSSIGVRGTVGYAAPEYGFGGEVSPTADIYSYGILLLELMTRKRPTDDMFKEDFNLHMYAKVALPNQVLQIVDVAVTEHEIEEADSSRGLRTQEMLRKQEECMMVVIKIGVACSNQLPHDRMEISAAISELQESRNTLLNPRRRHNFP